MKGTNTILSRLYVNYGDNFMALEIVAPVFLCVKILGQKSHFQFIEQNVFYVLEHYEMYRLVKDIRNCSKNIG
jgi:hypothetical protein